MNHGPPPIRRVAIETRDPEVGHQWLRDMYVEHTPGLCGPAHRFRLRVSSSGIDGLRIDHVRHSMRVQTVTQEYGAAVAVQLGEGRIGASVERSSVRPGPGGWFLVDAVRPVHLEWNDVAVRAVRLDLEAVRTLAEELTGHRAARFDVDLAEPLDAERAHYWSTVCDHVDRNLLSSDALMASPLIRRQAFRTLGVALIMSFPNAALGTLLDPTARTPAAGAPATVRRAVAFIDEHAAEPIGIDDVARAARIGVRALQLAFRKHRDTTPLEYLRRVRIELAHRDLQDGDPTRGDTVAARWGFVNHSAFSMEYRRAYGRPPSRTLRG